VITLPDELHEYWQGTGGATAIKLRKAAIKNNVFSYVFESSIKP